MPNRTTAMATRAACTASVIFAACGDTAVYEDVVYDDRYGEFTTMDIHMPGEPGEAGPAVMMIHGGGWRYGAKESYTDAAERLAAAGFVTATINYRLVPTGTYPAAVQDCLCALSFLRVHADDYGIDPDRIAVMGYSAGGHLSALVALGADEELHQPDCEWGPTAAPASAIPADSGYDLLQKENDLTRDFLGGTVEEMPERYRAASPLHQIGAEEPPVLVVHGRDDIVPVSYGRDLHRALVDAGNDAWLLDLGGAGHINSPTTATDGVHLQPATDAPEVWAATIDFLDRTLGEP